MLWSAELCLLTLRCTKVLHCQGSQGTSVMQHAELWEFGVETWKHIMETQRTAFGMVGWCQKCLQKSTSANHDMVHWRNRNIQTVKLGYLSLLFVMSLIFKPDSSFAQRQRFPPNWATSCSSGHGYMRCRAKREMGWVMTVENILRGKHGVQWFYMLLLLHLNVLNVGGSWYLMGRRNYCVSNASCQKTRNNPFPHLVAWRRERIKMNQATCAPCDIDTGNFQ